MPLYTIRYRWNDSVLVRIESGSFKLAVEAAVRSEADLRWADLRRADLRWANLRRANLSEADLRWADLRRADLRMANLRRADLRWANLRMANLSEADLREAALSFADLQIPVVEHLDSKILAALEAGGTLVDMDSWHQCQTTHCRAGWAIHLAGEPGRALETRVGSCAAGTLIYQGSAGYVPDFYARTDAAMADIRAKAAAEQGVCPWP